mgnify:CR=1 FL=1
MGIYIGQNRVGMIISSSRSESTTYTIKEYSETQGDTTSNLNTTSSELANTNNEETV